MSRASTQKLSPSTAASVEEGSWPTLAANPERTSWTPEEVRGDLNPLWYRPFKPFINGKIQVIAANGLLYISTARGLYALNADNGDIAWVYPAELPLGHSPTIHNGVLYVGGFDRKIHAVSAQPDPTTLPVDNTTGYRINDRLLWTFTAGSDGSELGAGFETNPLVVGDVVYAGNRNGIMYAIYGNDHPDPSKRGKLYWKFKTEGPIRFSAAYKEGVIYFGSTDAHAYALDTSGKLLWKSAKLPGAGFHSYWPVVYRDWVIFAGSLNYAFSSHELMLPEQTYQIQELRDAFKGEVAEGDLIGPRGNEPGDWAPGTVTIDAHRVTDYFEDYPERRWYFVLNGNTGEEFTFDSDGDGKAEYAPILWSGTHSGNKYPPAVGEDGVLYQGNLWIYDQWIGRGQVSGWKFGTPYISNLHSYALQNDEPYGYAIGGNVVYYSEWFSTNGGAADLSKPNTSYPKLDGSREWNYYSYNLRQLVPGYTVQGEVPDGVYQHQTLNPPIPYRGKVYTLNNGGLVAWGITSAPPVRLPVAEVVPTQKAQRSISTRTLEGELAAEVQKMIQAGHLRPGYHGQGLGDLGTDNPDGDLYHIPLYLTHYFSSPAETIYTLLQALPHLPPDLQKQTRVYLQAEFNAYPPYDVAHIGWRDGAPREAYDPLPEVQSSMDDFGPQAWVWTSYERFPQQSFYALWKYAEVFGGAREIFAQAKIKLEPPPSDSFLAKYPFIHNAFIAGYWGYLELERLAGEPESAEVRAELEGLLDLRARTFSKDAPDWPGDAIGVNYNNVLNVSRNFINMVPELADYLHDHAFAKVQEAVDQYEETTPYWFVTKYDATYGEGTLQNLYDYPALFQAKALVLNQPREELAKYLDVPAFERGDLFYIQNLVAAIEADGTPTPPPTFADVPPSHKYFDYIETLYRAGYTAGCGTDPLIYCPDQAMTRAESAVFVERGVHGVEVQPGQPASQTFADLTLESWAAKWAEALYADGYTAGCGADPLVYCPWQGHTRAEGAVFYLRMLHGADFQPPAAEGIFSDTPAEWWGAKWAEAAYGAGLIEACGEEPLRFCPDDPLTRGLAAFMMVRAKGLTSP